MEISITWNICRVCLAEEEKKPQKVAIEPMHHIFNEDEMLAKQIFECSGIKMTPNDKLPEKICNKCHTLIKYAVRFREICRASDVYLQNILQHTTSASSLLKQQQSPLLDSISNDESGEQNETSMKSKHKNETHLEKLSTRFKDTEYADVIEFENVDFENENALSVTDKTLEYTESCINEDTATDTNNDESKDSEIILQLNILRRPDHYLNDEIEVSDDRFLTSSEKECDDSVEDSRKVELTAHNCGTSRDATSDTESESGNNQAKVSSTVWEDGLEIMKLEEGDTKLSIESSDMPAEYIIDEYVIDDNSRGSIPMLSSPMLFVQSKKAKSVAHKFQKHKYHSKADVNITATENTENFFQVWVCDICGNNFGNRQLLNAHIKVHRQEKNHECEICLKRFITACNLQAHMRTHTGEKPYECKYCGRRFTDRSSNLRHERTHTNERPFKCKLCEKAFSLSTTLKKHEKVHSGERSYRCDICDKSFKLPHQLKAHKMSTLHKAVEQLTQTDE